jgi:hypothetical protein
MLTPKHPLHPNLLLNNHPKNSSHLSHLKPPTQTTPLCNINPHIIPSTINPKTTTPPPHPLFTHQTPKFLNPIILLPTLQCLSQTIPPTQSYQHNFPSPSPPKNTTSNNPIQNPTLSSLPTKIALTTIPPYPSPFPPYYPTHKILPLTQSLSTHLNPSTFQLHISAFIPPLTQPTHTLCVTTTSLSTSPTPPCPHPPHYTIIVTSNPLVQKVSYKNKSVSLLPHTTNTMCPLSV